MPSGATRRRNTDTNRNYSETTDSDRNLLTANVIEWWKGGQAEQAAWLTGRLKAAEEGRAAAEKRETLRKASEAQVIRDRA